MIQIDNKHNCCGCSACAQRCPNQCIAMVPDEEGFLYPKVEVEVCSTCGLCEKVCPIRSTKPSHELHEIFAAKNPNEDVRIESSSGGVFTMLAESVIRDCGVVFGAKWDEDWNVEHSYEESIEGLKVLRSSKYVQSNISDSFKKAESFLKQGRKVLFAGTPCQIAGLKAFLRKADDNLLTVECACHGVPSPGLWRKYLDEASKGRQLSHVNHRDKRSGWRNYSVVLKFKDKSEISELHDDNAWMRAFIKNMDLRPSCYQCAFKTFNSQADITLADLWGDRNLMEKHNDDKGITLVMVHSPKGDDAVRCVERIKDFSLMDVVPFNGAIVIPPKKHPRRSEFMSRIQKGESFTGLVRKMTKDTLVLRIKKLIHRLIK